ncbi:dTDP-4-dehydrorhamnose 3,5-epimerase family protein [bacterium]|nr:dTDP-4-dehydrorhamnose 3,5-epimerase family protein [bacterium]MDB4812332.1 dTDP-4-dehydrorhamnose 3,5-epimerase family protein [Candidatus Pelagibacter sp.]
MFFKAKMIKGVVIKNIKSNNDYRGFFREIMKKTDTYTNITFKQISHSKIKRLIKKGWHVHKKQYQWNYLLKGKIEVYLLDLRKSSKTYKKKIKFIVSDNKPTIYFFPPNIGHGYIALEKENHIIYGTSGVYSVSEEYKLPFKI